MHSVVSWGLRGSISFALDLFVTQCFITGSCVQPRCSSALLENLYEVKVFIRDETVEQDLRAICCSTFDLSMRDPFVIPEFRIVALEWITAVSCNHSRS